MSRKIMQVFEFKKLLEKCEKCEFERQVSSFFENSGINCLFNLIFDNGPVQAGKSPALFIRTKTASGFK